jgi:hypothetical protein
LGWSQLTHSHILEGLKPPTRRIRLVSEDGGDEDLWQLPDVFFSVNRRTQRYGVGMM